MWAGPVDYEPNFIQTSPFSCLIFVYTSYTPQIYRLHSAALWTIAKEQEEHQKSWEGV